MNSSELRQRLIGTMLIIAFSAGCTASTAPVTMSPPLTITSLPTQTPPGQPSDCSGNDLSPLGILRSADRGATWTFLGNACMKNSTVWAVDPTGFVVDGRVVLYFVDFDSLAKPVPQVIYRATSVDGVNFDAPQPAYSQTRMMVDPVVLRMADGSFRLYVPSHQEGIISAVSSDGFAFTRENGVRITDGGMPAALLLPDNRVRMFLNGMKDGQAGIFSMISSDGLDFAAENGMRISAPADNIVVNNAQPIRLTDGSYLMLYQLHDAQFTDRPAPWTYTEIHIATSTDGFNWTANPTVIAYGGTACVVETADGVLFVYYVNR